MTKQHTSLRELLLHQLQDGETAEKIVSFALTDLRLFAHAAGEDFERALRRSLVYFQAEKDAGT